MRGIGASLAPEVHFGITALAGHRGSLGRGWLRRGRGRGLWAARVAEIIVRRAIVGLRAEALHRGPCLHQCAVD